MRLLSIWNVGTKHMEQNIEHPFHLSNIVSGSGNRKLAVINLSKAR